MWLNLAHHRCSKYSYLFQMTLMVLNNNFLYYNILLSYNNTICITVVKNQVSILIMCIFIKLSSFFKFAMPFFYISQPIFSLICRSIEKFQVTGIVQYILLIVSTCSALKETLKRRGLGWQVSYTLPLLWFISTESECATLIRFLTTEVSQPHTHVEGEEWE